MCVWYSFSLNYYLKVIAMYFIFAQVHILGVEILTLLMSELLSIMKESGKSFVSYISDLLSRCKLQKSLLHCLLASVYNMGRGQPGQSPALTKTTVDRNGKRQVYYKQENIK